MPNEKETERAPRNRTINCCGKEAKLLQSKLLCAGDDLSLGRIENKLIQADTFAILPMLPRGFVDLLIIDPPYNLSKNYHGKVFKERNKEHYRTWFKRLVEDLKPVLKSTASVYVCSDWKTSIIIAPVLEEHFHVRNRITWEREKGRGAKSNWKNNTEDIWFCTTGKDYTFNVDAVKLKRKVIAPYRVDGKPKDWEEHPDGNFRLTHPSNIWTDISVPFWSMPENTDHPTQKPEKLIAKLVLASSRKGDFVFDPFLGSGTTAVVASKLDRKFCGIEQSPQYCCLAQKRLELARSEKSIQGFADGVFWDRNLLKGKYRQTRHSG